MILYNHYYIIYKKSNEKLKDVICIVSSEESAKKFCKENPDYDYLLESVTEEVKENV